MYNTDVGKSVSLKCRNHGARQKCGVMCKVWGAAADLGMFSMFGQTGAPTKRGPTRQEGRHFLQHSNMPEIMC